MEFKLWTSPLLGRYSTTWAIPLASIVVFLRTGWSWTSDPTASVFWVQGVQVCAPSTFDIEPSVLSQTHWAPHWQETPIWPLPPQLQRAPLQIVPTCAGSQGRPPPPGQAETLSSSLRGIIASLSPSPLSICPRSGNSTCPSQLSHYSQKHQIPEVSSFSVSPNLRVESPPLTGSFPSQDPSDCQSHSPKHPLLGLPAQNLSAVSPCPMGLKTSCQAHLPLHTWGDRHLTGEGVRGRAPVSLLTHLLSQRVAYSWRPSGPSIFKATPYMQEGSFGVFCCYCLF
jgi:hypothetical protein